MAIGERFVVLDLPWGDDERGCELSVQPPFGSGRYVPVCATMGMTDSMETYAAIYLVDLTTHTQALLMPPREVNMMDWGAYVLTFVQHMDTVIEPADGLP